MRPATEISIVIPTFRRSALLRAAVVSCLDQLGLDVNRVEIVVVDNSPEGSARDVIAELGATAKAAGFSLRYIHESRPGISHARNSGVRHSAGELVAFLDDDEAAEPSWLKMLHACLIDSNADFVMGPVNYRFDTVSPKEIEFLYWFYGRRWHGASGEPVDLVGMGNCLMRRDRCLESESPFDPTLGLTGGEDARFLAELRARGGRVVWCAEAGVTEYCPASRATLSFIMMRMVRKGQIHVRALCWRRPIPIGKILARMFVGAGQCMILGPAGLVLWFVGPIAAKKCLAKAALGLGKVFWAPFLTWKEYGGARKSAALDGSQRQ